MTRVSVVMTTYEGARYVAPQLASILAQTVPPTELLIGDDASTDGTVERARAALAGAPFRWDITVNPTRLGVTRNLEGLLRRATGDVVFLCDQDDEWESVKVETVLGVFATRAHIDGVFSDASLIGRDSERLPGSLWKAVKFGSSQRRSWQEAPFATLMRRNVVTGATMAVRATALSPLLPISPHGWHDHWLAALLAERRSLLPIERQLVRYRLHGANYAGLPSRGVRSVRLPDRQGAERRLGECRQLEDLAERFRKHGRQPPAALLDRLEHLRFRQSLPSRALARAGAVARRLPNRHYWQFSSGWRSVASDLVDARQPPK